MAEVPSLGRALRAFVFLDVVGYSARMSEDEEETFRRVKACELDIVTPIALAYRGALIKTVGDGFVLSFDSLVDALCGAIVIQDAMRIRAVREGTEALVLRAGVHFGDAILHEGDVYGSAVNTTARLEGRCEPGGICILGGAIDELRGKLRGVTFDDQGEHDLKNIGLRRIYFVRFGSEVVNTVRQRALSSLPREITPSTSRPPPIVSNEPPAHVANSRSTQSPPIAVSAPPPDFVGREEEIAMLTVALTGPARRAAIAGLRGMGGIGKTTLAREVARRLARVFVDGMLEIALDGLANPPKAPEAAMAEAIRLFDPTYRAPDDRHALIQEYRRALSGRRVLLVLDNARDREQVRDLLPAVGDSWAAVVTSRASIVLPGLIRLEVEPLPLANARDLVRDILGSARLVSDSDLDVLIALTTRLPLALRAAATLLAMHPGMSVERYGEELSERRRLARLKAPDAPDLDVEAVLRMSVTALATTDALLAQCWNTLAVFPADFDATSAAAIWECNASIARDRLDGLTRCALLEFASGDRYQMHDLLRDLARDTIETSQLEAAHLRHAKYYSRLLVTIDAAFGQGAKVLAALLLFDIERRNIEAAQQWASAMIDRDAAAALLCIECALGGSQTVDLRLLPRTLIRWLDSASLAAKRLGRRDLEGKVLGNLALAYGDLREYDKAITWGERSLSIAREVGDRRAEGNALGNLASYNARLGNRPEALAQLKSVLAIMQAIGDRRGEGVALANLGNLAGEMGNLDEAESYFKKDLSITREVGDLHGEGITLGNIGITHAQRGDHKRALEYYHKYLETMQQLRDRRLEGHARFLIADALYKMGDRPGAIAQMGMARELFRAVGVPDEARAAEALSAWLSTPDG
jgi:class 3 adenylate cyclase/tetratricopeptide (TPR) repeat protein